LNIERAAEEAKAAKVKKNEGAAGEAYGRNDLIAVENQNY